MIKNSILNIFFLIIYKIILYHIKNSNKKLQKISKTNLYSKNKFHKTSNKLPTNQNNFKTISKKKNKLTINFHKISLIKINSKNNTKKLPNQKSNSKPIKHFFSKKYLTITTKKKLFTQNHQKLSNISNINKNHKTLSLNNNHFQKTKTTIILFSITILFIISFIPYTTLITIQNFNSKYYNQLSTSKKSIYQFFIHSYFLSNTLNPLIYKYINKHFKTKYKNILKNILYLHS